MPMTKEEMKDRIAELDTLIAEYPYWGAALTAYDEERNALQRNLAARGETDAE